MSEQSIGVSYVVFRLGDEEFGIPVAQVNGIIRYEDATPVPRAPAAVLGVINIRGRVVPVVDLKRRFSGTRFEPSGTSRILVAEGRSGFVGLAIDSASEVTAFADADVRPVPDAVLTPETGRAFLGVVERPGGLVILIDLDEAVPRTEYEGAAGMPVQAEGGVDG